MDLLLDVAEGWIDTIASKLNGKSDLEKINDRRKKLGYEPLLSTPKKINPISSQAEKKNKILQFLNSISDNGEFSVESYGDVSVDLLTNYIGNDGLIDKEDFAVSEAPNAGNLFFHGEWEDVLRDFAEGLNIKISNYLKQSVAEKLGDNRPKLGSKRDAGKSVRKWRGERGLDEVDAQNFVGGMTASYQARENQPVAERHIQDYMEEARS